MAKIAKLAWLKTLDKIYKNDDLQKNIHILIAAVKIVLKGYLLKSSKWHQNDKLLILPLNWHIFAHKIKENLTLYHRD